MANLRPGYRAPNSKSIGNPILEVFSETTDAASKTLAGERVTLCVEGWSNINNDPIVAASIQYGDRVYVVDSVDTSGLAHTGEILANLCDQLIEKAQETFGVVITAVVSDNAGNMIRMQKLVSAGRDIVQYGCSAHQLDLLAKDLGPTRVTNSIVEIAKFFRNTHLPKSWLKDEGATKPPMPCTVRWSSSLRLLKWYSEEWAKIKRVIDKHLEYFSSSANSAFVRNAKNLALFQQVTDAIKCLTTICVALSQIQDNSVRVAQAVEAWKVLLEKFRGNTEFWKWLEKCEARYNVSVPDVWFVANLLHSKLIGNRLTQFELKKALSWIKENKPGDLTAFLNYIGSEKVKVKKAFTEATGAKVENFLKAQNLMMGNYDDGLLQLSLEALSYIPSTGGLERMLSSMGFIHSDLRNRLDPAKVNKLAFCLRVPRDNDL